MNRCFTNLFVGLETNVQRAIMLTWGEGGRVGGENKIMRPWFAPDVRCVRAKNVGKVGRCF